MRPVGRALRRALGWALFGRVVLGGVLLILLPSGYGRQAGGQEAAGRETGVTPAPTAAPTAAPAPAPAPGPGPPPRNAPKARARAAVVAGVPAALPDLAALIRDREAQVRDHPKDARSWAVLGSAYVERGGGPRRRGLPEGGEGAAYVAEGAAEAERRGAGRAGRAGERAAGLPGGAEVGRGGRTVAPKRWTAYPLLIDA